MVPWCQNAGAMVPSVSAMVQGASAGCPAVKCVNLGVRVPVPRCHGVTVQGAKRVCQMVQGAMVSRCQVCRYQGAGMARAEANLDSLSMTDGIIANMFFLLSVVYAGVICLFQFGARDGVRPSAH